jgi:NNP family nitrate/nitrite transporter-like MFS transporter
MMFAVLGIPIKTQLGLNETEFGLLAAMPVLSGSLVRVPLGIWTDKLRRTHRLLPADAGERVLPIYLISAMATAYWHFLVLGLFVGLAGGSFSVGTPYVARWLKRSAAAWPWGFLAPVTPVRR